MSRRRKISPRHDHSGGLLLGHPGAATVSDTLQSDHMNSTLQELTYRNKKPSDYYYLQNNHFKKAATLSCCFLLGVLVTVTFSILADNLHSYSHTPLNKNGINLNRCSINTFRLKTSETEAPMECRIFYFSKHDEEQVFHQKRQKYIQITDPMLHVDQGEETIEQPSTYNDNKSSSCVPMQEWQTKSFPTCNNVHELDMQVLETRTGMRALRYDGTSIHYKIDSLQEIGKGWFRNTWKLVIGSSQESFVLKTLRFERDYLKEYFELHRRESVAMERLTISPYVINIHSFCGQSTVNEYADFIDGYQDFKSFAKQLRGNNEKKVLYLKLQIAAMISLGVQHIHEVDGPNNATMVHYDLNPMNIAITSGGIPKINDFNVVEFMNWDPNEKVRCGFKGRFREPWWRSPEEMIWADKINFNNTEVALLDEKVDIYSLGNILYILLIGHTPRGVTKKDRMVQVQKQVRRGALPSFDNFEKKHYWLNDEPAISAMREAIKKCYEANPTTRSSGREIASLLLQAMVEYGQDLS